jgi:hypothetical protein
LLSFYQPSSTRGRLSVKSSPSTLFSRLFTLILWYWMQDFRKPVDVRRGCGVGICGSQGVGLVQEGAHERNRCDAHSLLQLQPALHVLATCQPAGAPSLTLRSQFYATSYPGLAVLCNALPCSRSFVQPAHPLNRTFAQSLTPHLQLCAISSL